MSHLATPKKAAAKKKKASDLNYGSVDGLAQIVVSLFS